MEDLKNPEQKTHGEAISLPTYIDETSLKIFSEKYGHQDGQLRFSASVMVEDWLVQGEEIGSADFELQDNLGPNGWWQTVEGKVWNAALTDTPQYQRTTTAPVLALVEAELVAGDERKPISEDPSKLVLVRLDRMSGLLKVKALENGSAN